MQRIAHRILAFELRSKRFGFVLIEMPGTLLDWGTCGYGTSVPESLRRKMASIVDQFSPVLILARERATHNERHQRLIHGYFRLLKQEARRYSIPVQFLSANSIREYFQSQGKNNKHEISQTVATYFPELAWRLPKRRKPWQSEPAAQVLFDAAALALLRLPTHPETEQTASDAVQTFWSAPGDV